MKMEHVHGIHGMISILQIKKVTFKNKLNKIQMINGGME